MGDIIAAVYLIVLAAAVLAELVLAARGRDRLHVDRG